MLNKYESIYIVKPDVEEQGIKELIEKFNALDEVKAFPWKLQDILPTVLFP